MKAIRILSIFCGVMLFLFGFLKFFNPFKVWVTAQVTDSHLPHFSIGLAMAGEMITGLIFLVAAFSAVRYKRRLILLASFSMICMMAVAMYVHWQPGVPAEVLPMKIKPPVIPGMFLLIGVVNVGLVWREKRLYR